VAKAAQAPAPAHRRLMTAHEAADYLGEIPLAEVKRLGIGRVQLGRHARYDRHAIDAFLDRISNPQASSQTPHGDARADNDDADAALARFEAAWKD
jgi:hypothetical protein